MSEFVYTPDFGASRDRQPRVTPVKFGDSYEARNSFGMNIISDTWSVSFSNRDASEALAIDDFLTARGGVEVFEWTAPGDATAKVWVCRRWSKTPVKGNNLFTVSATFEQVFEPA